MSYGGSERRQHCDRWAVKAAIAQSIWGVQGKYSPSSSKDLGVQVKHSPISSKLMAESALRKRRAGMVDLGTLPPGTAPALL